jgi:hypothetical protein
MIQSKTALKSSPKPILNLTRGCCFSFYKMLKESMTRISFAQKKLLKKLEKSMSSKNYYLHKGLKLQISGRINGSKRKKKLTLVAGRITSSSLSKNLHHWQGRHYGLAGVLGLKFYKS